MTYLVRGLVDQSQNLFNLLCVPLDCEGCGGNPPVHQGLHHAAKQDHRLETVLAPSCALLDKCPCTNEKSPVAQINISSLGNEFSI
jgi:hypothetical protein